MSKPLTITDLLKQKEQLKKKQKKTATLYVESLDAEIEIEAPDRALFIELVNKAVSGDDTADAYAVLQCVKSPNLKDENLQKEFKCLTPIEIVDKIFEPGEIAAISGHAMELAGYGKGVTKVEKEIKN
jgi:hypothetical protein